jgi:hypothetical protein
MTVARRGDGGGRTVGNVAVGHAIAVVHGTDKSARTLLPSSAFALRRPADAVPRLQWGSRALLEEFLLLAALVLVDKLVLHGLRRMRRLGMRLLLHRPLRLLRLHPGLLAGLVLAAPAAAPMPMRLHLTVVRRWPLFRLGLGWFCCHDAYTSWCFAFWFIEMRV